MAIDLNEEQLSKIGTTAKKIYKPEPDSVGDKIFSFLENIPKAVENVKEILKNVKEIKNPTQQKATYERPTEKEELQGFDGSDKPQPTTEQIDLLNLDVKVDNALQSIFVKAETQSTQLKSITGYDLIQHLKAKKEEIKMVIITEIRK